ncbi:MAG TPA: nucleotide sugar dehydrogenase [Nitrososphaeraceae archaeon]|nr:nucleotide sugar dehydrogenase [Nitrososphaeraceae archaeon]
MKTKSRMKPTAYSSSNTNSDINKTHNTNINNARIDDTNNSDYEHISHIEKKIKSGAFKIAVYGLGHIGSALASVWLRQGAHVIGVDKSSKVLENAKIGKTHLLEPGVNEAFTQGIEDDRFEVYEDLVKASLDSYFKMICVPVLATNGSADLTAIKDVATSIGKGLKKFDVVALNPSVPPGTTEEVVLPILEKESGFKAETDFYMIYNPERIYEGRAIEDIEQRYPAIVSGAGVRSLNIGTKIYSIIFKKGVIAMSSIRTAETEKLLEGVYRDVNIALANELAKFCEKVGIDFWEARDAANSQPFCHIHKPGVGVGGACIPVYPQFILHTADQMNIDCNITRMGRNINDSMPAYSVERATELLKEQEEKNNRKKQGKEHLEKDFVNKGELIITLLGLAFRGGVSDTRLSPTYKVIEEFQKLKVKEIRIHDPLIINDPSLSGKQNIILTSNLNEAIQGTDLVMLITDHPEYRTLTPHDLGGAPIYDGRGILDRSKFDHSAFASIGVG